MAFWLTKNYNCWCCDNSHLWRRFPLCFVFFFVCILPVIFDVWKKSSRFPGRELIKWLLFCAWFWSTSNLWRLGHIVLCNFTHRGSKNCSSSRTAACELIRAQVFFFLISSQEFKPSIEWPEGKFNFVWQSASGSLFSMQQGWGSRVSDWCLQKRTTKNWNKPFSITGFSTSVT